MRLQWTAHLVNYLWPLFLIGVRLRVRHGAAALLGISDAELMGTRNGKQAVLHGRPVPLPTNDAISRIG